MPPTTCSPTTRTPGTATATELNQAIRALVHGPRLRPAERETYARLLNAWCRADRAERQWVRAA